MVQGGSSNRHISVGSYLKVSYVLKLVFKKCTSPNNVMDIIKIVPSLVTT